MRGLWRDTRGVSTVEYGLLLVAILLVVCGGYRMLGKGVKAQVECAANFDGSCSSGSGGSGSGGGGGQFGGKVGGWESNNPANSGAGNESAHSQLARAASAVRNFFGANPTFADGVRGPRANPIDNDLAQIADGVYTDKPQIGQWRRLSNEELVQAGIDPSDMGGGWGYRASVYTDDKGHYVPAFAGTDDPADGVTDLTSGVGTVTPSTARAMKLGVQMEKSFGKENIVFTGHSLGGGLATAAALATGAPAVTFNSMGTNSQTMMLAAGVAGGPGDVKKNADGVRNVVLRGEILNHVQDNLPLPETVGHRVEVDVPRTMSRGEGHKMGSMLEGMAADPRYSGAKRGTGRAER